DFDLADQSNAATTGHAQGQPLSQDERESIVAFEMQLFSAQQMDFLAGLLTSGGARGGPEALIDQEYYFGINDPLGADPAGFNPLTMTSYDGWMDADGEADARGHQRQDAARAAIVRGQALFNSHPISITGVGGL